VIEAWVPAIVRVVDRATPVLLACCMAACGAGSSGTGSFLVTDSAGVEVVINTAPAWREGEAWTLASQPALDIGVVEGDSAYQLFRVRDAVRLTDGRIVVANGGSYELRYYDPVGAHLKSVGRVGDGPGEFQGLDDLIVLPGDSLLVVDFGLSRVTLLDGTGALLATYSVPPPFGRFPDGTLVRQEGVGAPLTGATGDGVVRAEVAVVRYTLADETLDTLVRLPGDEIYRVVEGSGGGVGVTGYRRPFGRFRRSVVHDRWIMSADGSSYEAAVFDLNGRLTRLVRVDRPNRPVTAQDQQNYRERFLASIRDGRSRSRAERMFDGQAFPAAMPALQNLKVDGEGNLWLEEYQAAPEVQPRWALFDPQGRWLGTIDTPHGLRVTDLGSDYVLGIARDQLDTEHVRLYRLMKPPT